MSKGKIRHMFPGGNTSQGFFSYYHYILSQEEATRIIIIKGGPGVGKSTFMKKIGEEMVDRGFDVEFMHCSSDNNSLDGVVIPEIKVAFMDGTAPHIVDPKSPGAVDEIINFGDFWNEEGMRVHKDSIIQDNRDIGRFFARAYRYLKAAAAVYEDSAEVYRQAIGNEKVNALSAKLVEDLFGSKGISVKEGKTRKLFASAITPNGLSNYLDTVLVTEKVYELKGEQGMGMDKILERIYNAAVERGYDVEAFYCALLPDKLEHLVIPELDISFTTSNNYHKTDTEKYMCIEMIDYVDKVVVGKNQSVLEENKKEFELLLNKAISTVKEAKALHDRLETYYIPNIDFEAVQLCFESTLARILEYIKN